MPNHPRRAALCRRAGAPDRAERRGRRAHRAEPRAGAGSGRLAQQSRHRPAGVGPVSSEAIDAYQRAIALDPRSRQRPQQPRRRCCGRPAGRRRRKRRIAPPSAWIPTHIDAYTNLGILLNGLQRTEESVAVLLQGDHAAAEAPRGAAAAGARALHARRGRRRRWRSSRSGWRRSPDDPIARHMLAACTGRDVPPRASDAFVAADVRQLRGQLRIEARQAVVSRAGAGGGDAGGCRARRRRRASTCSTPAAAPGLCGPLVAPYARRLTGVDLSAGMLAQAEEQERLRRAGARRS